MSQPSKEAKKRWLDANKHKRLKINKDWKLRAFYGITPEDYQKLLEQQNYKCAICQCEFVMEPRNNAQYPHLDHEHDSGWVRGILCQRCNHGIGLLCEDVEIMSKAIEYVIANSPPTEFNITLARDAVKVMTPRRYNLERIATLRAQMSGNRFREGLPAWNKGKQWNEDTRKKMSVSAKNRWKKEGI